ncbi:sulfurtransferase [Variovorax sp. N23]|uniref:sulfurtransferase n=1 Tax=Variovorax sp. N23 TaxID=2980555 RepID=UPI0021CAB2C7|nr:sulfurtransferase [Variovorax sp. N23]MCU4118789.1 sulfurtransferase [Variovorax sp. N23]
MDAQLVSTSWLAAHLDTPGLVVLDCGWYLPDSGKKGVDDFLAGHIPGARYLDLEQVSDPDSPYVNMRPSASRFESCMRALGIDKDSLVVVYDAGYVSARIWWMLRTFGHEGVRILDGGWRKWKAEGRPVEAGPAAPPAPGDFVASPQAGKVAVWQDALAASRDGTATLVDARTAERFTGAMPSGYPGVPGGHIPDALNAPWSRFMDPERGHVFVNAEQARDILVAAGVDLDRPVITTCGSGVTAAILALMLDRIDHADHRLYDGSWHEWAQRDGLPRVSVTDSAPDTAPGAKA